jgi:hypothetical protein
VTALTSAIREQYEQIEILGKRTNETEEHREGESTGEFGGDGCGGGRNGDSSVVV